jgi:AbrB family looped-hinge helix DNA binding protein
MRKIPAKTYAATRLTTKGQVVIPKTIRSALGWRAGTRLRVEADGSMVKLVLARPGNAASWLKEVAGCVREGDPVADLEAEHRREVEADANRRP